MLFEILFLKSEYSPRCATLTLRRSISNTGIYHSSKNPFVWSTTFSGSLMVSLNARVGSHICDRLEVPRLEKCCSLVSEHLKLLSFSVS